MKIKSWSVTYLFYLGAIWMVFASIQYIIQRSPALIQEKAVEHRWWYDLVIRLHILGGLLAMLTGPSQFNKSYREKNLSKHRFWGHVYFFAVLAGGLSGLAISPYGEGGVPGKMGMTVLSSLWLSTAILALSHIHNKEMQHHKFWMFINFGFTFSAVTFRSILLLSGFFSLEYKTVYGYAIWVSWIINLIIACSLNRCWKDAGKYLKIASNKNM